MTDTIDIEGLKRRLRESGCRIPIADVAHAAIESIQRENAELRRELEEARKDAKRYRFELQQDYDLYVARSKQMEIEVLPFDSFANKAREDADSEIDIAARHEASNDAPLADESVVTVPKKYPLSNEFDEELFNLCRGDCYAELYEALIKRAIAARQQKGQS